LPEERCDFSRVANVERLFRSDSVRGVEAWDAKNEVSRRESMAHLIVSREYSVNVDTGVFGMMIVQRRVKAYSKSKGTTSETNLTISRRTKVRKKKVPLAMVLL
jgi:hypothetical protein